jgi:hypothetical protein
MSLVKKSTFVLSVEEIQVNFTYITQLICMSTYRLTAMFSCNKYGSATKRTLKNVHVLM